jgi:hypothetical protein
MSSPSWLHDLRFALAPGRSRRLHQGRASPRAATHRLNLEVLEDRVTPSFSPATNFPVGPNPQAVVAADFNNDDHLDLATANAGGNTVSVLLGDGRGGFGAAKLSAAGTGPQSLTVGDFNRDRNLDLATVSQGRASVLLGIGDGTFRAPTNLSVPAYVLSVAMGDFNSDGNADLVVSAEDMEGFGVFEVALGNGRGSFTTANWVEIDYPCPRVALGDINGDGKLDAIAVPDGGGSDGFPLLGNGDGTFDPDSWYRQFVASPDLRAVAVGDFTGDGIPDLVTAGQTVDVLRGHGDGWFDDPISHTANGSMHTGVMAADFNGDGHLDAVTSDADTGTVSELRGNGNGTLTYVGAYAVGSSPAAVAIGDFNGDGRPDMAAANAGSNTVSVLLNNSTWTPPLSLKVGDATVTEGNTGTALDVFTVTLSAPSAQPVIVQYATANGTATAGIDYQARIGTLTIPAGQTTGTISVPVLGDRVPEPNESFSVHLSGATNAAIADGQAVATIVDDEPRIRIDDVSQNLTGNQTVFTFTITLSAAYDQAVTVAYRTADGTARAGLDYLDQAGTITFAPGETQKRISVVVLRPSGKKQPAKLFYLDLSDNSSNSLITKQRGVGTIRS